MASRWPGVVGGLLVTAAAAAVLAGCSSSAAPPPTTAPSAPRSLPVPSSVPHAQGAVSALTGLTCAADASGTWSLRATLVNSTPVRSVFLVDADVVDTAAGTVFARVQRSYTLAPGGRTSVVARSFYRSRPTGLRCVPNVRRAPA